MQFRLAVESALEPAVTPVEFWAFFYRSAFVAVPYAPSGAAAVAFCAALWGLIVRCPGRLRPAGVSVPPRDRI